MTPLLAELCAGTASLTLWALGRVPPLTGYMGSKRRWASVLSDAIGPVSEALLVDAGPWGDTWSVLRERRARLDVAGILTGWQGRDPADLWRDLVARPPEQEPAARVAQYLWLQARSAGTIPIWWSVDHGRWESPSGSRTENAHARGGCDARSRSLGAAHGRDGLARATRGGVAVQKGRPPCGPGPAAQVHEGAIPAMLRQKTTPRGARGMIHPRTLALRVLALEAIDWGCVRVVHGDVRSVEPIPGATAYMDPPYLGCPRYAALLPRADVLELALRWSEVARVAVSEAEPLHLEGWASRRLTQREWVTTSWPIALPEQIELPWEPSSLALHRDV